MATMRELIGAHLARRRRRKRKLAQQGGGASLVALAISDFKAGVYSLNGAPQVYADLWVADNNWWASGQPTLTPGVGLTLAATLAGSYAVKSTQSTAALKAAIGLATGFTVVADMVITEYTGTPVFSLALEIPFNNGSNEYYFDLKQDKARMAGPAGIADQLMVNTAATRRVAISFTDSGQAGFSVDGGAVTPFPFTNSLAIADNLIPSMYAQGNGTVRQTLEKLTFYPLQSLAALPALSTL